MKKFCLCTLFFLANHSELINNYNWPMAKHCLVNYVNRMLSSEVIKQYKMQRKIWYSQKSGVDTERSVNIINRPGVAGAVLQTALAFSHSVSDGL